VVCVVRVALRRFTRGAVSGGHSGSRGAAGAERDLVAEGVTRTQRWSVLVARGSAVIHMERGVRSTQWWSVAAGAERDWVAEGVMQTQRWSVLVRVALR
jgi:hypothetical protein